MNKLKKILQRVAVVIAVFLLLAVSSLYFFQEKLIFFPTKLKSDHRFQFPGKYEEVFVTTTDKVKLNGLLFKADSSKGLIFYLHGNGGCIESAGAIAPAYTALGYDLFLLDYRGYGKSEGEISGEQQFFDDIQQACNQMKLSYTENKIVILGYSIGTGSAARLASVNNPKMLILQAPYYSLLDMMHQQYKGVPDALLKYKFETYKYVKACKVPVVIFHGNNDEVINYTASLKLKELFKPGDELIILDGRGHGGFTNNPVYLDKLAVLFGN